MNFFLSILFIISTTISFSQNDKPLIYNYANGGYIDAENKYHSGFIYFADQNSAYASFKEQFNDKSGFRLSAKDIKSFNRNGDYYEALDGIFYKKLNSDTKIQLFRTLYTHPKVPTIMYFRYYVKIKDKIGLTYFHDPLIKNFAKKVSVLLSDCSELSQKIVNKMEGYIYEKGAINLDLWRKVAKEYETCNNY